MENQRSLKTILEELRERSSATAFNQYHRQLLDRLRDGSWVTASRVPDAPGTKMTLLRNGWIERRDTPTGIEYRITQTGLAEVCMPR
ncbi:hypothetical protein JQ621_31690 [Bradyrhizobium manausense]|uniref:hypothetical protein n=1 Tax=Bradyrhizobium manausense TaxID=989370 RepID=UPI001BACA64F|nr:hypothetical protein [Bradyrhizobium manausense]MBR1092040.1 hypothetical protein [Bradyrhizobium manausense]